MMPPSRLKAKRTDICMPSCALSAAGGCQQVRNAANMARMVSILWSGSTGSPCFAWVLSTVTCKLSPSGNGYCGWHGRWRKTLHTVGRQGWPLSTLQVIPPRCAWATALISANAMAAQAQAVPPKIACRIAYRPERVIRRSFHVGRDLHLGHRVGILDRLAFGELVDHVHAGDHLADDRVVALPAVGLPIHDEELAVGGIVVAALARHPDDAALERHVGKLGFEVGILRPAGAVVVLPVAGLRHEAFDHAVERDVVVEAVAGELFDALGVIGREIGAQLDDDAALGGVDHDRVVGIDAGGQLRRRPQGGRNAHERDQDGENADHGSSWLNEM